MIKDEFLKSLSKYTSDSQLRSTMFSDIEKNYSNPNRYYHTLSHLNHLASELTPFKNKFADWNIIVFAIAYHDIIYNTLKSNNEEKSAAFATKKLNTIGLTATETAYCSRLIMATKRHEAGDLETNLFTDADLSILGADQDTYREYSKQIRQEYSIYPDLIYNPGRKKVLTHFLEMKSIYKTNDFSSKYESSARFNLETELNSL